MVMSRELTLQYQSRFGGVAWATDFDGVYVEFEGLQRTPGEPITMRRLYQQWGAQLHSAAIASGVPVALLMMTLATESGMQWKEGRFTYPALRKEPGYLSDEETPHRISFGPMHVLLSTYRAVMGAPTATRDEASDFMNNVVAGALYIKDTHHWHNFDPVLVAATYNAGGVYNASSKDSKYHNRWHIRAYGNHLDRAARWYGDALAVLNEKT